MHIQHEENGNEGRFFIPSQGNSNSDVAELEYHMETDSVLVIEHVEVDEALQGKNIGFELVSSVVEKARENNSKIRAVCPFAKSVFNKNEAFSDVLE